MPKVYLDETGFDTFFYRPYAYACKGVSVKERISGRRYQRLSLVAAQTKEGLIAPMVYENTMDSALFETCLHSPHKCNTFPNKEGQYAVAYDLP